MRVTSPRLTASRTAEWNQPGPQRRAPKELPLGQRAALADEPDDTLDLLLTHLRRDVTRGDRRPVRIATGRSWSRTQPGDPARLAAASTGHLGAVVLSRFGYWRCRRRTEPGVYPLIRVKARLNAASDWYPSSAARRVAVMSSSRNLDAATLMRQRVRYAIGDSPASVVKRLLNDDLDIVASCARRSRLHSLPGSWWIASITRPIRWSSSARNQPAGVVAPFMSQERIAWTTIMSASLVATASPPICGWESSPAIRRSVSLIEDAAERASPPMKSTAGRVRINSRAAGSSNDTMPQINCAARPGPPYLSIEYRGFTYSWGSWSTLGPRRASSSLSRS